MNGHGFKFAAHVDLNSQIQNNLFLIDVFLSTQYVYKKKSCRYKLRLHRLATSRLANIFGNGAIYRHDKKNAPEPEIVRRTLRKSTSSVVSVQCMLINKFLFKAQVKFYAEFAYC